ncbi:MAG: homoserine O-acetyltransferase MetX [Fimbriimonadaceae bacterium]
MSGNSSEFGGLFHENARTAPIPISRRYVEIGPYDCEAGGHLPAVTVAYETWGELNSTRSNAVLVCHALSGDSHCVGWWDRIVGPGKPIDTAKFYVIGTNALGGCQGTTGPSTAATDGLPYGSRFPIITIGDIVAVQARLLDHLGIDCLELVAGGSMGGMQALEWTVRFPLRVRKAFVTASCIAHSAMQIGFNEGARQAIMRDSAWQGGRYEPPGPVNGLALARMIGHLTFLSEASFEYKFSRRYQGKDVPDYHLGVEFEVESYLQHQGDKFTSRFDANSLLYLTRAIDYYELKSLDRASAEFLFTSFTSDWIYPSHQSAALHRMALDAGCVSRHVDIDLPWGHDCFLLDSERQGAELRRLLA